MNLKNQRRMAAQVLGVGANRVKIGPESLEDVAEAITREDIRILIHKGVITARPVQGSSRGRIRKREVQKGKGRSRGYGSRTGTKKARSPNKPAWIKKIRAIRDELQKMREAKEIDAKTYRMLYRQAKGNLFHSRRHVREHAGRMKNG